MLHAYTALAIRIPLFKTLPNSESTISYIDLVVLMLILLWEEFLASETLPFRLLEDDGDTES